MEKFESFSFVFSTSRVRRPRLSHFPLLSGRTLYPPRTHDQPGFAEKVSCRIGEEPAWIIGSSGRIRTYDQAINSRPLYH